mmetsp:Transcript_31051/g.64787  ORF Transcript_31051/g.64787 Transcript_31051/m.64787 type:complete len:222 (+) Transcript_31051:1103-1768(+)
MQGMVVVVPWRHFVWHIQEFHLHELLPIVVAVIIILISITRLTLSISSIVVVIIIVVVVVVHIGTHPSSSWFDTVPRSTTPGICSGWWRWQLWLCHIVQEGGGEGAIFGIATARFRVCASPSTNGPRETIAILIVRFSRSLFGARNAVLFITGILQILVNSIGIGILVVSITTFGFAARWYLFGGCQGLQKSCGLFAILFGFGTTTLRCRSRIFLFFFRVI